MSVRVIVSSVGGGAPSLSVVQGQGAQGPPGPPVTPGAAAQIYQTNAPATLGVWNTLSQDGSITALGALTVSGWVGNARQNTNTPEKYDANAGSGGDDTAAITSALNALAALGGGKLELGAKRYTTLTGIAIPASTYGISIVGQGSASQLYTPNNITVLTAHQEHTFLRDFDIVGNSTGAAQDGIHNWVGTSGTSDWACVNVRCLNLGGTAFYIYYAGPTAEQAPMLSGCLATSCGTGFVDGAEYAMLINCVATLCARGCEVDCGNFIINGCNFSNNTKNLYVTGGGNDGHGTIANTLLNHGVRAIEIGTVGGLTNGILITGCQAFYGDILLKSTNGVRLLKNFIDVTDIYFDGSLGTVMGGNTWSFANANTVHNNYNGHASTTRWLPDNVGLDGAEPSFIPAADDATSWTSHFPGSGLTYFGGPVASVYSVAIGPLVGATTSFQAVYMLPPGTAPTTFNASVYGDGNNLYLNLRSGSYKFKFQYAAATDVFIIDPTGDKVVMDLTALQWGTTFSAAAIGTNKAGASLVLKQDADVAAWTLSGGNALAMQAPATATSVALSQAAAGAGAGAGWSITAQAGAGTNDGGALSLGGGAHAGAGTADGSVKIATPLNAGFLTKVSATTVNLTNAESDANIFLFTAGAGGAFQVNFLRRISDTTLIFVRNTSGQTATIAYLTGGTVTVATGTSALIASDGANLQKIMVGT